MSSCFCLSVCLSVVCPVFMFVLLLWNITETYNATGSSSGRTWNIAASLFFTCYEAILSVIRFHNVILTTQREAELNGLLGDNTVFFYLGGPNFKFLSREQRSSLRLFCRISLPTLPPSPCQMPWHCLKLGPCSFLPPTFQLII